MIRSSGGQLPRERGLLIRTPHLLRLESGIEVAGDGQWETTRTKRQHTGGCLVLKHEYGPARLTENGGPHAALQPLRTVQRAAAGFRTTDTWHGSVVLWLCVSSVCQH
jgi:hypothetical protein